MAKGVKILAFLNKPLIKGLVKSIPFVGDVADNVLTETATSKQGEIDKGDLTTKIIRLSVLVVLLYLVFSGKLSMDEAESAKDFITD